MKIWTVDDGKVFWTGKKVDDQKILEFQAALFDLGSEYIEDLDLIVEADECPNEVLEVLAKWRPSDEDTTPRVQLLVTRLSDEGARILSGWNGNGGFGRLYLTELTELTDAGAQHLLNSGTCLIVSSKNLPASALEILSQREVDDPDDAEDGKVVLKWLVPPWES